MMQTHSLNDAITACEQALQPAFQQTQFMSACQKLGNMLQGMGRFQEAMIWHTQASAQQPDLVQVYAGVGRIYILQHQWQAAAAAYETTLRYDPNFAEAYWKLGSIAVQLKRRDRALMYWYHALALEPHKATADGHVRLGNALLKLGHPDPALACYRRAIRRDADYAIAYIQMAEVLKTQGHPESAIALFQQAIERVSNPGWAYYELGRLLQAQGQIDETLAAFRQSIEHDPTYPWARHDWAELLLSQQRWAEAIALSRATLAVQAFPWAYTQLGRALAETGELEEAIVCHQAACELRDWPECKARDYQFTQDWFSHNIPIWTHHLQALTGQPHLQGLEIGSFQGMSACWLLDRLFTHPSARLTCIDPNFQPQFHLNLSKTGADHKVTRCVGSSHQILPTLPPASFDLIYIDGCHLASHVEQDGLLSWKLLKPGGLLIFDDYHWMDPNYPGQDPKLGIDRVLATVQPHSTVLHHGYQVIAQKTSLPSC